KAKKRFRVGNLYINRKCTGAMVGRQPFGGFKMSGIGSKAGGPDYLLQFVLPRTITENTLRRGFAPETQSRLRLCIVVPASFVPLFDVVEYFFFLRPGLLAGAGGTSSPAPAAAPTRRRLCLGHAVARARRPGHLRPEPRDHVCPAPLVRVE